MPPASDPRTLPSRAIAELARALAARPRLWSLGGRVELAAAATGPARSGRPALRIDCWDDEGQAEAPWPLDLLAGSALLARRRPDLEEATRRRIARHALAAYRAALEQAVDEAGWEHACRIYEQDLPPAARAARAQARAVPACQLDDRLAELAPAAEHRVRALLRLLLEQGLEAKDWHLVPGRGARVLLSLARAPGRVVMARQLLRGRRVLVALGDDPVHREVAADRGPRWVLRTLAWPAPIPPLGDEEEVEAHARLQALCIARAHLAGLAATTEDWRAGAQAVLADPLTGLTDPVV